ncbi:MAG: hypothetical protein HQ532_01490, partial [Candidatus Omnitrophica bacterium]|nr:hypothetical protein [Candidatus Omnitrophota bacterium]
MKNYKIILILLVALVGFFSVRVSLADSEKLTIVFSGDMRGELQNCRCPKDDFGGLNRRSMYISEVKEEVGEVLLLDVGDVLPLLTSDGDKNKISHSSFISFKAMDIMGYDAMNVGESDLALGEVSLVEKTGETAFTLISANIVDEYTGEPFFEPYVIKVMKNGLRVGILGLVNERYVLNSDRLEIASSKDAASKYIPELKSKSDIVIVLGHLGLPYSVDLAESIDGIDVILNGHWDVDSQEPIEVGKTLVMSTTHHSRKVGRLDLKVHDGGVYSYEWKSTQLDKRYEGANLLEEITKEISVSVKEQADEEEVPRIEDIALERPLRVFVFGSSGCRACMEIERDLLPEIEQKYGDSISIEKYDIGLAENYEQMIRLERLYGVEGGYAPEVVVSRHILMGKEEIVAELDEVIHDALEEPVEVKKKIEMQVAEYHPPAESLILSRFESFSIYAVMAAGLLDGVNPCAFTTIVFFISFLALVGYKRREMFFAGTSFTAAVFVTYLLIGLGIFRFLRAMKSFGDVTIFIDIAIGTLAFLLGVLSLIDYFRYKKSKDSKGIILRLPG